MIPPAVRAIARHEWRRRWRSLVLLGLVGALLGGVIVAGTALMRRTSTAPARLAARTQIGDAHLQLVSDATVAREVSALPMVTASWVGRLGVARLEGPNVLYVGVLAELPPPLGQTARLVDPVIADGRSLDQSAPDEILVREDLAATLGLRPGDVFRLAFLTPDEVDQFDTGFGEPDGPRLALRVVGTMRLPPGVLDSSPVLTTQAFALAHPEVQAATDMFVRLAAGRAGLGALGREVDRIVAAHPVADGPEDFAPVYVDDPFAGTAALVDASRVLVGGMVAALVVAVLASIVICAQAWSRHFAAASAQQHVERALGLSGRDRVLARLLPGGAVAVASGLVAAGVGVAASALGPVGGLSSVEPDPGFRVAILPVVVGGVVVAVVLAAVAAWGAARAGRRPSDRARPRRIGAPAFTPRRAGWPLAGVVFARSGADPRRPGRVSVSMVASILGVAGLVGAIVFTRSMDRLAETPARYGWPADLAVIDANPGILQALREDDRIAELADVQNSNARIDGSDVDSYSFEHVEGSLQWSVVDGRLPSSPTEVMLGTRLADRLDAGIGDRVEVNGTGVEVVGIGLGPPLNSEQLGSSILFSPDGIRSTAASGIYHEGLVKLRPGVSLDAVSAELGARYELTVRSLPAEVRRVADLGWLPMILGWFLAGLAALALVHGLTVTARRRARDLAVLRAIGATPGESGLTLVSAAAVNALVGLVVGVPLGWAVARLVWGELARSIGVGGDVVVPSVVVLAIAGTMLVSLVLAVPFWWQVCRRAPAQLLRVD